MFNNGSKKLYLTTLALLYLCPTWAQVNDNPNTLKQKLNFLKSMTAKFKQVVKEGNKIIQTSSGSLFLQRPGKFRWQAQYPMAQLIVSNGTILWVYDEDLEQVTVKKLNNEINGTPALFLSGYDNELSKKYDITEKSIQKGKTIYTLNPKKLEESNYQWLKLTYKSNYLLEIFIKDKLGQTTELSLSKIKLNNTLNANLFNFIPPKDVDVVYQ